MTISNIPQVVPGLLAWIRHAYDWELNRRACVDFPLQTPDAAILPEQDAASIAAMMTLRARFPQDANSDAGAVIALFDAMNTNANGWRAHALAGDGCLRRPHRSAQADSKL